jgi:hypothetical protein
VPGKSVFNEAFCGLERYCLGWLVVFDDGTAIALVSCMVAELTLTRIPVCKTHYTVRVYREGKAKAFRRKAGTCLKLGAIVVTAVLATVTVLTYNSYRSFAQLIDQQIAGGYLRSHAGLNAAPREIEKGARLKLVFGNRIQYIRGQ